MTNSESQGQVSIVTQMRAVQYDRYGPPEVLQMRTVPTPTIRPGYVLAHVLASSVNEADVTIRKGTLKLLSGRRFPRGVGFDFVGDIVAVGSDVQSFRVGDGIWGFVNGIKPGPSAAAAEYVLAPVEAVSLRPQNIDPLTAAALPGVGAAAIGLLRDAAKVKPGERVLIRGAAGGVGTAAIQVALALGGRVTALVSAKHIDQIRALGAEEAFVYHTTSPQDLGTFDVVLDVVGKDLRNYRRLLARHGRMITTSLGGPGEAAYAIASSVFGGRRVQFVQKPPTSALLTTLKEYVENGTIKPIIDSTYPLENIVAAHRSQEVGQGFGKRVIRVS